jgi:hypothetical protein
MLSASARQQLVRGRMHPKPRCPSDAKLAMPQQPPLRMVCKQCPAIGANAQLSESSGRIGIHRVALRAALVDHRGRYQYLRERPLTLVGLQYARPVAYPAHQQAESSRFVVRPRDGAAG